MHAMRYEEGVRLRPASIWFDARDWGLQFSRLSSRLDSLASAAARKQGVSLDQIAIFYSNLTSVEKSTMSEQNLVTHDAGEGMVIARSELMAA